MSIVINFNPKTSAEKVKYLWGERQKISLEIVQELSKARDYYSNSGYRSDLVPDGTRLDTFEKYLIYIGFPKRTAYNWLERYVPEEQKLLTFEELKVKKEKEEEQKRIEYFQSNEYLQKKQKEDEERTKRIEEMKQKEKERIEEQNKKQKEYNDYSEKIKEYSNAISESIFEELERSQERKKYSTQVKDLRTLYEVIDDYLDGLEENNKIECLNNIIKYCRNKANNLHSKLNNK